MAGKKASKKRLDWLLVERGLADNLALAQALIMAGKVLVNEQRLDKAAALVDANSVLRVKGDSRYVSRAGEKLAGALIDLQLTESLRGAVVLDVGASTGGFTQCCLEHGAKQVIALDVGTNQLAWELRQDERVVVLEQTDVRNFKPEALPAVDWLVADVSFNSLARLAPALRAAAPGPGVGFLVLVKPQFELERDEVPNGGVVIESHLRLKALVHVKEAFLKLGLPEGIAVEARLSGKSGNREIFYFVRAPSLRSE